LSEHDVIDEFLSAMREHGLETDDRIIADGTLHRFHVIGDKSGSQNGWYVLHAHDERPAGSFGCNKKFGNDAKFSWSAENKREFTPEEKRAWARKMEQARRDRERRETEARAAAAELASQIWEASEPATDHPYLTRKGVKSHGLRVGVWTVTNPETQEVTVISKNALLIPIKSGRTEIHSLQAIFPNDKNRLKRDRDFLKNGAKRGLFFTIGAALVDNTILIVEGYATGATLHESTGHLTVVAFDAGNLLHVAETFRKRLPDAKIVICADNDQWTERPVKNPGVTRAMEAANAADCIVAIPQFNDLSTKPTDFNDLAALEGHEAVKSIIDKALSIERVAGILSPPALASLDSKTDHPVDQGGKQASLNLSSLEKQGRFTVLGYDHGHYFIFHFGKSQILTYTKSDFTDNGLIELANINFWDEHFPTDKGIDRKAAFDWFVTVAHSRGIYDIDRIRGRGAWLDEGRNVYHHGGYLTVDTETVPVTELRSRYVYELKKSLPDPAPEALSDEDGRRILDVAKMFRWTKPASAALLAGWTFLAPICGALRWRPHLWITGSAGCGKSTALIQYANALIGESGIFAQGNSTEAGIRQELQADAIPVLYDEGEQNEEADKKRVQQILSLIRQASTESQARTLKGTPGGHALRFHIRSMFCLASIQVGIRHQADVDRLTILTLRRAGETAEAQKEWEALDDALHVTIRRDTTVSARMLRRAIELLPTIQQNIKIFGEVAAERFGRQREGDQYGTLLAGAWSLVSTSVATKADAERLIDSYDWSEHREKSDSDESMLALAALSEAHIRMPGGVTVTVYELVCAACEVGTASNHINKETADSILLRYGMRVRDGYIVLSNSSNELKRLMQGTTFEADLRGMLLRIHGADRNDNVAMKFNGVAAKCIRIPVGPMIDGEITKDQQVSARSDALWQDD